MLSRSIGRLARPIRVDFLSSCRQIGCCTRTATPHSFGGRSIASSSVSWAKRKTFENSNNDKPNYESNSKVSAMDQHSGSEEKYNRNKVEKDMDMAVARLRQNMNLVVNRVGRLTPRYLDGIKVWQEEQRQNISAVAQVIVVDSNTLSVVPYDSSYAKAIEQAIYGSRLNLAPKLQSDGSFLMSIPKLTLDTRRKLAKESGELCEVARAAIRNIRQAAQKSSRADLDDNLITKDDYKDNQKSIDNVSKTYGKLVDGIEAKSKAVLLDN
ncbi:hypothetical protein Pst134EB_006540 [Puccinia striiformis f. sp. tritici]|nr:hypothetical protein Pst134EB_006540 [Puccinia striiformis f. sp. tritici]